MKTKKYVYWVYSGSDLVWYDPRWKRSRIYFRTLRKLKYFQPDKKVHRLQTKYVPKGVHIK